MKSTNEIEERKEDIKEIGGRRFSMSRKEYNLDLDLDFIEEELGADGVDNTVEEDDSSLDYLEDLEGNTTETVEKQEEDYEDVEEYEEDGNKSKQEDGGAIEEDREDKSEYYEEEYETENSNNLESEETEELEETEWFDDADDEGGDEYTFSDDEESAYDYIRDNGEDYNHLEDEFNEIGVEDLVFYDKDGNPVNARKPGKLGLDMISISDIIITERIRREPRDISKLESSLSRFEQITPIHVTPYGENKFLLVDGFRRINALINIGEDSVLAYVDSTISPHAVRPFESLINNKLNYTYAEKFSAGKFFEERQEGFSYETIEDMVGLKRGEYLKMIFIEGNKDRYPDIYEKVLLEKMTPEQGERKILKEEEKSDEESARESLKDELETDDKVRDRDSEDPYKSQNKEERSILDGNLKTAVLTRDGGVCQACGEGIGEPEISQLMNIHHIIPVELFGPDRISNLITLCPNCHDKVHYYDDGRYKPDGELLNKRKNSIILGNMIQELRDKAEENNNVPVDGMAYFNESPYDTYLRSSYQSDFVEGVEDNLDNTTLGEVKKVYTRRDRDKLSNTRKDFQELMERRRQIEENREQIEAEAE